VKELKFVDVGEGITEGHIQKWLVNDGDQVKEDQPVVQIETDKAVVNIPAPVSGTIKINANEDSDVKVGDVLAYIGSADELGGIPAGTQQKPAPKEQVQPQQMQIAETKAQAHEILAAPSVRRLAEQLHVDLSKVTGTGPHGRILENDVRRESPAAAPSTGKPSVPKYSEVLEEQHKGLIERLPLTQTRKAIAKNMEASWTIPKAAHMDMINATALYDIVQKKKESVKEEFNTKLTFLPFIIKATVEALKENPRFNASYDHENLEIILKKYYNIGLAAEAPDGLKVVVIKDADKKSIVDLAKEIEGLHQKITNQTITLEEMRDSTFTITNIGSLGGGFLSVPAINYPEVAILGTHLIKDMPIVENNEVKIAKILPISLVFDHRVVDGADAAKFSIALMKYLQDPEFLEKL